MSLDRFVGLPWLDGGRDASGLDCWGLVRLVYAESGIELPSHSGDYVDAMDKASITGLVEAERGPWQPVPAGEERPLDGVLIFGRPWHMGLVVSEGRMLHMPHGHTSAIVPYRLRNYSRRIEGFYRHEALA